MDSVPAAAPAVEDLSVSGLADRVRQRRAAEEAAQRDVLLLAVAWADAHPELDEVTGLPVPVEEVPDEALAAHFVGLDPDDFPGEGNPAWAGLPSLAWEAGAGFAVAAGISARAGQGWLRDGLVLRHRLPRLYARIRAGEVPVFRARMVAAEVAGAPDDVVAAIDTAVAPRADRIGFVALKRLLDEAMLRLYPDEVEAASLEQLDSQHVHFDPEVIGHAGLGFMDAKADYVDLQDLDQVLSTIADRLAEGEDPVADASLQVRRAKALGIVAHPERAQELLDTAPEHRPEGRPTRRRRPGKQARRQSTELVVRLSEAALGFTDPVASVESSDPASTLSTLTERAAQWCGRETSDLTVLPVLDVGAHDQTEAYRPTAWLARQVTERDRHCLFPFCHRPARRCDLDHLVAHDPERDDGGGATCSCNLIPLCRHHHRLKTHLAYDPAVVEPGVVWWTTPHGHELVVDRTGTRAVHRAPPDPTGCLTDPGRHRSSPRMPAVLLSTCSASRGHLARTSEAHRTPSAFPVS